MLTVLSVIVALSCAAASARRLRWAIAPTGLDPAILRQALAVADAWPILLKLQEGTAGAAAFAWEHELLTAFVEPDQRLRDARVNEQLTELDGLADHWARVPRVCASIATSAGFLFASIWLLGALVPAVDTEAIVATLLPALDALAVGIAGTSFCAAVHVRARAARRARINATDRLIETLQAIALPADAAERARGSA